MEPDGNRSLARRLLPWLSAILLAAAIYDGAIFYGRWNDKRAAERNRVAQEGERARKVAGMVGGDTLKILAFYVSPGAIRRGEHATLCYGVNDAKAVRVEPPVGEVWPAFTRCLPVSPRQDTDYKLTAEDGAGHAVSESVALKVTR